MARFYITTAIDYANGDPHLGHAYEKIGADVIARYHRLRGDDVHFLIGMDEHGQKVAQAASSRGVTPQEFVDEVAAVFRATWDLLGISYNQFIRTTDPAHEAGVRALLERTLARSPNDFYEKSYEGWYCVGCELFKRDSEIVDGKCVLHPTRTLEWTQERNWFFRLTHYQDFLENLFTSSPDFLQPETRRNEMLALLGGGLEDISITRSRLTWAIPFPKPTADGVAQGTWVWFDALPNYLTATGFPEPGYESRWPAQLHVIGKDITRLHAIVWPAMLQSAGLALPEHIFSHGFALFRGERFSKSGGVSIDLAEASERYGRDAFRYLLLREIPFHDDGSFTWERFSERYGADLANGFGNLASRVISMVERYRGGTVPGGTTNAVDAADAADLAHYRAALERRLLHEGLQALWRTVDRANEHVQSRQPWALAKDPAQASALDDTLATLVRQLARQAVYVSPFMPSKAEDLWAQLGAPGRAADQRVDALDSLDVTGWRVRKGEALFPREQAGAAAST